jgi:hypothetical protein
VRSPYLTLATLAPWASTCSLHTSDHLGRVPRATAAGYYCGLPRPAHEDHRYALPGTSREDSSGIHRLTIAWGHPVAVSPPHHWGRSLVLRGRRVLVGRQVPSSSLQATASGRLAATPCGHPGCNPVAPLWGPLHPGCSRVASGLHPPPYRPPPGCNTVTMANRGRESLCASGIGQRPP